MRPICLHSHTRPLTQLKFNREGDLLFSSGKDNSPMVWRTSTGEKLGSYDAHNGAVWCIDVTGDSSTVATGGADTICKIWDAKTGALKHNITTDTSVRSVNFKQDGSTLVMTTDAAMGCPCEILYFDLRDSAQMVSGTPYQTITGMDRNTKVTSAVFGSFDRHIITGHQNGEVNAWDEKTGEKVTSMKAHTMQINDMQKSVDGDFIVTASKDNSAQLLNSRTLEKCREYKTQQPVNSAAMSSLKDHIIMGGGQDAHEVTTTDSRQGKFVVRFFHKIYETEIGRVKGHFGPVNTVAFHPDGKSYASGGEDGFIRYHHFDENYYDFEYEY